MSIYRVRRSELYTRSQSASPTPSEPDPGFEAQIRARLASIYGPPPTPISAPRTAPGNETSALNADDELEEEAEQAFEFRLFSSAAPGKPSGEDHGPVQKIILVGEEEEIGDGGFVVRERNRGYYFAEKADGGRKQGYEVMALSGEDVLNRARRRAWGLEVPWRVRVLKVTGKKTSPDAGVQTNAVVGVEEGDKGRKRRRYGKKRRITLRERKKSREKLQEQKKAEAEKRDEEEREKRTRRNREKKVKRKMKEKAKKAGGTAEDAGDIAMDPGEPSIVGLEDQVSGE